MSFHAIERRCEYCGKPFVATHPNIKICSDECRKQKKADYEKRRQRGIETAPKIPSGNVHLTEWCHSYAELQKQQTLAMIGRVQV